MCIKRTTAKQVKVAVQAVGSMQVQDRLLSCEAAGLWVLLGLCVCRQHPQLLLTLLQ